MNVRNQEPTGDFRTEGPVQGIKRQSSRGNRWKKRLLLAIVAGILLFACWTLYIQIRIGQGMTLGHNRQTDVGIVLGASLWDNKPSPALQERLEAAYEGYRREEYPMLIVSGGLDHPQMRLTEAEGMAAYLEERGVPKERILLENKATSTYENLLFSKKIMQEHDMRDATIVTHRFHGARALDIAEFLGYEDPQFALAPTQALNVWQTRGREMLAFTKWLFDKPSLPVDS